MAVSLVGMMGSLIVIFGVCMFLLSISRLFGLNLPRCVVSDGITALCVAFVDMSSLWRRTVYFCCANVGYGV